MKTGKWYQPSERVREDARNALTAAGAAASVMILGLALTTAGQPAEASPPAHQDTCGVTVVTP
jgi:hypothetical protein